MLLKIVETGDGILRKIAKKVSPTQLKKPDTQKLIDLMIATLRDKPGVGLAAPQVGESLQIVVVEDKKQYLKEIPKELLVAQKRIPTPLQVIINPSITITDSTQVSFFEGCLSVEGYRAVVPRADKIRVSGLDREGHTISIIAEGWAARIIQHEVDHLNGILYIDTMKTKSFISERHYSTTWAKASPEKTRDFVRQTE